MCRCGLYALRSLRTSQLQPSSDAVGAIAGWGDLEVHRTDFRAQYACVIDLIDDPRASSRLRAALERAAERYGVPLLPARELRAAVREHAAPLPPEPRSQPKRKRRRYPRAPSRPRRKPAATATIGYWVEEHLWVKPDGDELIVGVTNVLVEA